MKAKFLMVAMAFFALTSIAVAQETAKTTGCCKGQTECSKAKDADKPASCAKAKTTEKTAQKAATAKQTTKTVQTKK